ncbi:zinc finger protein 276 isoform X1 [Larimichthys crocea]|uniref:zinc finger protein 276 isoform X1 n=1 Tax=Larimichthys crocea TaxID=215358 RepID=UPI000F5F941A|nr:zinc finger protein 276 isoform X1 [Larimichthys crocea]XP_027128347.1 zinc finger protein 276 isoform X1 [Larimichthys crocea]
MKKKSRRGPRSNRTAKTASISEAKRPPGNRGRPRKTVPVTTDGFYHDNAAKDETADVDFSVTAAEDVQKHPESKSKSSAGRLSAAVCRLCHGKFSPRSLRHAFNTWPQDSIDLLDDESDAAAQSPLLFHTDFQRLVGVRLDRDPRLSEFICKKCHAKFYKCHSILIRFLQRVNLPPVGKESVKGRKNAKCPESSANHGSAAPPSFTSDPKCLHSLVSWAHHHGEACRSCPDLKEVLEGQCWGSVKAVWGCVDGHRYTMDTQCTAAANPAYAMNFSGGALGSGNGDGVMSEEEEQEEEEDEEEQPGGGNGRTTAGGVSAPAQTHWSSNTEDFQGHEEALSPAPVQLEDRTADSDLSDRVISEDDFDVGRKGLSDDELFEPFSDKRPRRVSVPNKRRRNPKASEEPKIKKKPGPKPGWKNKFKPKGEELPNIYKCPYQGCTAVYRAPDGLKKHIKEHHEEVRERPCPHPGCNKVFMIDRYLQRHVKLIHTEERNYICDQCGQTFKQRKHLSVHQMRHSGAKPLQCEVCGFQCRQRASLKYHMTKHKAEADLEFACLMCGKRFEKAHNLNVHMSMVHPLTQAEAQRGGGGQQQQQQLQQPLYSDLHTITLTGEVVQQDHDR